MKTKKNRKTALLEGSPVKSIILFGLPILATYLINALYTAADAAIVGHYLNENSFAAVNSAGTTIYFVFSAITALCTGCTIVSAQRYGANDRKGVHRSIAASYTVAAVSSILTTILIVAFLDPLLRMINTPDGEIFHHTKLYLLILFLGLPITAFNNIIAAELRALGDSITPTIFMAVSAVVNVGLNIVFIIWLKMGVDGVAYATIISQLASGLGSYIVGSRNYKELTPPLPAWFNKLSFFWEHLRLGIPMSLQFMGTGIGFVVLQAALNSIGKDAINAASICGRVEGLLGTPISAIGTAVATFVAQNYGAKAYDRIRNGVNHITIVSLAITAVMALIFVFGSELAVNIFMSDANPVIRENVRYFMRVSASLFLFLALIYIHRNTLQGLGYATVPFLSGIVELIARITCSLGIFKIVSDGKAQFGTINTAELLKNNKLLDIEKLSDATYEMIQGALANAPTEIADKANAIQGLIEQAYPYVAFANPSSWFFAELLLGFFFIREMRKLKRQCEATPRTTES